MLRIALRILPALAVLVAGVVVGLRQRRELGQYQSKVRAAGDRIAATIVEADSGAPASGREPDEAEWVRLRQDREELLRLRSEIVDLRRAAAEAAKALAAGENVESLRTQAAEAQREARLIRARMQAEDQARGVDQAMSTSAGLVIAVANARGGQIPPSWEQVGEWLTTPWDAKSEPMRPIWLEMWKSMQEQKLNHHAFEILPTGRVVADAANPAGVRTLLLRERTPRERPDGGWVRGYVFGDGQYEEVTAMDGRFESWEQSVLTERRNAGP
ncbi:MAG: hypothetical protein IT580_08325 [Verrucomicrobiales bacterium]|jgi:hypothetical protein|nr:hypothetical protein [Verrucomicrobiales bacterium]